MLAMPGVIIKEAVYGLRIPPGARAENKLELFFEDASEDTLRRDISKEVKELIARNPRRNDIFGDFIIREKIASRAWFLQWSGDDIVSALSVNWRTRRGWTNKEKDTLRALFKDQLLTLLADIQRELLAGVGQSVPQLLSLLSYTWRLTTTTSEARDEESSFQAILEVACNAFGINESNGGGTIHLFQPDTSKVKLKRHFGRILPSLREDAIRDGEGLISWVILRRQPLLINDLLGSEFYKRQIYVQSLPGCRSVLAVPLLQGDELLGVLNLECTCPDAFSWHSVGFLAHAASQIAVVYRTHQANALYHSLVESLPQNVFRKDREGRFVFVNQRLCDALGRTRDAVIDKTDFDLFPAPLAEKYKLDDMNIMETGESLDTFEEHWKEGEEKHYVHVRKTPLYDGRGTVIGTQGIFSDVTEQKRVERHLAVEYDVGRVLAGADDPHDAISETLRVICEGLGWDLGICWGADAEGQGLRCDKLWHRSNCDYGEFVAWNRRHGFRRGVGRPGASSTTPGRSGAKARGRTQTARGSSSRRNSGYARQSGCQSGWAMKSSA